jgi:hypothetical protein
MRQGFRLALGVVVIFASFLLFCLAAGWLAARGIIPAASTPYVLLVAAAGMLGVIYLILYAAKRRLRKRFLARPLLTFRQWYEDHYKENDVSPEIAERVLTLAAKGIGGGVHLSQVLPTVVWFKRRCCPYRRLLADVRRNVRDQLAVLSPRGRERVLG